VTERFLLRVNGGPNPGDYVPGDTLMSWPLPATLPADGGHYIKVSESQLPPPGEDSRVLRGAEYDWQPDGDA
jgi:hypothetical protein